MLEGRVIRSRGNYFAVLTSEGELECQPRGRFRQEQLRILAGDLVKVTPLADDRGVIETVLPRRTELFRPPVANLDQVMIVFTVREPALQLPLVDRFLVLAEAHHLDILLVLSKIDLLDPEEIDEIRSIYRGTGYPFHAVSAWDGRGVDELRSALREKASVLAGQSGVGKSSLLNALEPGLSLRTGAVSEKAKRGRHTTRHVELLTMNNGGLVADSPGFSRLDLGFLNKEALAYCFPDFRPYIRQCRFASCLHQEEPRCAVREASEAGMIPAVRYEHYLEFLQEIKDWEKRKY
ncbi:MAG: ribosome small subunit-dependent GTPase A [Firmicutes bacterium]|nr:ribosome small subunit-dependent GTPase A [Bacillota bacterium]MCL5038293.1 ribosome small subunit-dependent GTPase A [Bacillota bacterium]